MRHSLLVWIALMVVGSTTISAQTIMTGVVSDSSGRSLPGVDVFLVGSSGRATTDSTGTYFVSAAAAGEYVARFRRLGYKPAMLTARLATSDTLRIDVILAPGDAQQLDPIDVRASMPRGTRAAFEERKRLGLGKFIDSTVLRRSEARQLSDLLRDIRVRILPRAQDGSPRGRAVSRPKWIAASLSGCPAKVMLDGIVFWRPGMGREFIPDLSTEFSVMSLEAVEFYRGSATVPLEFAGRGSECGVLVLWTRRGK